MNDIIIHLSQFVSRLWQIHIFGEGNTRTTAVFFIKYLRSLGFYATNDIFAENAWYFRNALVRANYNDFKNGIHETTEFLELFLRNLLLNENNILSNRTMDISRKFKASQKLDIDDKKLDIEKTLKEFDNHLSTKTIINAITLFTQFKDKIFGRSMVEEVTGLKSSQSSNLIKLLLNANIIEPVKGYSKGKYRFVFN